MSVLNFKVNITDDYFYKEFLIFVFLHKKSKGISADVFQAWIHFERVKLNFELLNGCLGNIVLDFFNNLAGTKDLCTGN